MVMLKFSSGAPLGSIASVLLLFIASSAACQCLTERGPKARLGKQMSLPSEGLTRETLSIYSLDDGEARGLNNTLRHGDHVNVWTFASHPRGVNTSTECFALLLSEMDLVFPLTIALPLSSSTPSSQKGFDKHHSDATHKEAGNDDFIREGELAIQNIKKLYESQHSCMKGDSSLGTSYFTGFSFDPNGPKVVFRWGTDISHMKGRDTGIRVMRDGAAFSPGDLDSEKFEIGRYGGGGLPTEAYQLETSCDNSDYPDCIAQLDSNHKEGHFLTIPFCDRSVAQQVARQLKLIGTSGYYGQTPAPD